MARMVETDRRVERVRPYLLFRYHLLDSTPPKTVGRIRTVHLSARPIAGRDVPNAVRRCTREQVLQVSVDVVRFCDTGDIARLEGVAPLLSIYAEPAALFSDRPILHRKTVLCLGVVALGESLYLSLGHRCCLSAHARNLV